MKKNSLVQFRRPFADEIDITYRVIEERGDRLLIEAIAPNLPYPPQQVADRADLRLVELTR